MKYGEGGPAEALSQALDRLNESTSRMCTEWGLTAKAIGGAVRAAERTIFQGDEEAAGRIPQGAIPRDVGRPALSQHDSISGRDENGVLTTFSPELVVCRQLFDADGKPIGVSYPKNEQEGDRIAAWAAAAERESDSHYRHLIEQDTEAWTYSEGIAAPWYKEGQNPIYLQSHSGDRHFRVAIDRGDAGPQIMAVTGPSFARVQLAQEAFHRALEANPGSPIVSTGCNGYDSDGGAVPTMSLMLMLKGIDRDVWGSPLLVAMDSADNDSYPILGVIAEEGKPDWRVQRFPESDP